MWAAMEFGEEKAPRRWVLVDVRRQPNVYDCGVLAMGHVHVHVLGKEEQDVNPLLADELRALSAVDIADMTYHRMPPGNQRVASVHCENAGNISIDMACSLRLR